LPLNRSNFFDPQSGQIGHARNPFKFKTSTTVQNKDVILPSNVYLQFVIKYSNMKLILMLLFILILIPLSQISFGQNQTDSQIKEWSSIGISLMQEGNFVQALEYFDKILELDPTDAIALGNKGAALTQLGKHDEALLLYDKALQINPSNTSILNNKAATLFELGKIEESLQTLDKILEIESTNVDVLILKGKVLLEAQRYSEAFSIFKKALEIDPQNESAKKHSYFAINHIRLIPVTNSKYFGHVVLQVRNSQGILVSVFVSDALGYLPHEITDEYLASSPVIELVEIDGQTYEKREFTEILNAKKSTFIGKAVLGYDKLGYDIYPFDVLPHGITIEPGDILRADWTIFKKIN
jgi:tetratricopeptide (TPR) repeat protein